MKTKLLYQSTYCQWACILVTAMSVGCRSAGHSGSNFFSWKRAPDAATLAGNTEVPDLPESPANKYTPNAIASVGAQTPSSTDTKAPAATGGSAYGYNTPGTSTAAKANGYQTGPYELSPPGVTMPSTSPDPKTSLPSPYGGTYTNNTGVMANAPKMPDIALPNSIAGALAQPGGYTSPSPGGMPNYPPSNQMVPPASGLTVGYPSTPSYPSGSVTNPAVPGQSTSAPPATLAYPSLPSAGSTSGSSLPPSSAYQSSPTVNRYSPGSTGRTTGYNFSPTGSAAPNATSPSSSLPPNTASGSTQLLR